MATEVITKASKWVVGGQRLQDGTQLPPIRAWMDDILLCTHQLLTKLNDSLKWARMNVKPSKLRTVSISKGKLVEERFYIDGEVIPSIVEKPFESLVVQFHIE